MHTCAPVLYGVCSHKVMGPHVCVLICQVPACGPVMVHMFIHDSEHVCNHGWHVMNEDECHSTVSGELSVTLPIECGPRSQNPQGLERGSGPPSPTTGGQSQGPLLIHTSTRPALVSLRVSPPPALSQVRAFPLAGGGHRQPPPGSIAASTGKQGSRPAPLATSVSASPQGT